jgi:TonB-dependent SusC/RagA subfamily outer membrane receptor
LFLIDGNPIELDTTGIVDKIDIDIYNIDFVDIIKGPSAAIYGSRGSNGVVAIYTKDGTEMQEKSNIGDSKEILRFIHPGYYKAREFYEPKYGTSKPEHKRPDYRTTLSWKPNIQFDDEGKAKIEFYTADISTTYRVELQGITSDGIPITSEAFINID